MHSCCTVHTAVQCQAEIIPRGGAKQLFFYEKGARKELDLKNNTITASIKGGKNRSRGGERPPPK